MAASIDIPYDSIQATQITCEGEIFDSRDESLQKYFRIIFFYIYKLNWLR